MVFRHEIMTTIDYLHIAATILFFFAALYKLKTRQSEHFFTRIMVALWFGLTVANRDMPVIFVREMSNYVVMLVPLIELIYPRFQEHFRGKK
jgi:hypothetical protein